jgi:hypothetical protein
VASGNVLGVGLRHALISAFIVTLYDVGSVAIRARTAVYCQYSSSTVTF